ncbi:MAG TPA: hypothetical protein DGD08_18425 [Gemmatimonas aurantiaca]|uniref:Uncharacterized protein n=1 Tax=Gemmatimonas aurantiaca TaxID=173480 RepID=A0A3D4VDJ4_9BACT|nr:hypothetical protein [Gemmatimonas aurantiaca]
MKTVLFALVAALVVCANVAEAQKAGIGARQSRSPVASHPSPMNSARSVGATEAMAVGQRRTVHW